MIWILGLIGLLAVIYLVRNGGRNSNPHNRKAAAEICEHLTSYEVEPNIDEIVQILKNNARYRKDAIHIASMVPVILKKNGMPWEVAKHTHGIILLAANYLPD